MADSDRRAVDVSGITVNVSVKRLDQALFRLSSPREIETFLAENPVIASQFLPFPPDMPDSARARNLFTIVQNPAMRTLYNETQRTFGSFEPVKKSLENAFRHVKYYYPDFVVPEVITMISGFGRDMLVTDSVIVIGLDFFIGDSAKYRPDQPEYILQRYQPEYIVPSIMLLVSAKYNQTNPADKTMLADMIFYGKSLEFAKHMLPDTPDSLLIGYTAQQLSDTEENRNVVWAHFVEKNLLYETDKFIKVKYVDERPYTAEIGKKAPGAIGRWLGWEIVKKYLLEKENVKLPELMATANAKQIFIQSNYKGEKN